MEKKRLSIKLNGFEYNALFHVQLSCIIPGLDINRAPQLNEIVKAIIHYVHLDITCSKDSLRKFFMDAHMNLEMPEYNGLEPSNRIFKKSGNYIFIADDEDLKHLEEINKLHISLYASEYNYTQLIRYCIHYIFYVHGFYLNSIDEYTKKAKFVNYMIIATLYGIDPSIIISILEDRNFNMETLRSMPKNNITTLMNSQADEKIYDKTTKNFIQSISGHNMDLKLDMDFLRNLTPESYREFDSVVKDFNFMSVYVGIGEIAYMWEKDSFDLAFLFLLGTNIKNEKGVIYPMIVDTWGAEIRLFYTIFTRLFKFIKGEIF